MGCYIGPTDVLHLSEWEAYLRIAVARASRTHPVLLVMLEDGRLHLSGIAKIAPLLTEANRETLLARAVHKSKREIEELVAEFSPKPDVPTTMRKLPVHRAKTKRLPAPQLGLDIFGAMVSAAGLGIVVMELECLPLVAASTSCVHEGALISVSLADFAPDRGRDISGRR